jgi:hypothetical protein
VLEAGAGMAPDAGQRLLEGTASDGRSMREPVSAGETVPA